VLQRFTSPLLAVLFSLSVATFSGCGDSGNVARVRGTVTLQGKALPGAIVQFTPVAGGRQSQGLTDDSGSYELVYTSNQLGAEIGKHQVRISTAISELTEDGGAMKTTPEKVPAKYNVRGFIESEVESGRNVIDFDI
jgi:hypothetical protein